MSKYRNNRSSRGSQQGNNSSFVRNRGARGFPRNSGGPGGRDMPIKPEGIYYNHSILSALSHLVGRSVRVRCKNDNVYDGIFSTISPRAAVVLKCAHKAEKKQANGSLNGGVTSPTVPQKDELCRELWFEFSEIISVTGKIDKPVDSKDKFMVDADVSRKRQLKSEPKELQRWTDDGDFTMKELSGSLDTESGNGWAFEDMIRTNQEKFDVTSVFDAEMTEYTVPVPECDDETKRKATQLADDIEKKATTNVHIAEERGQIVPVDLSEEDRYSAVARPDQYITITETPVVYSAINEIPAPLSQIDEPTEDVFSGEKEQQKAAALAAELERSTVIEKCMTETQTDNPPPPMVTTPRKSVLSPMGPGSTASSPRNTPQKVNSPSEAAQRMKTERSRKEEKKENFISFKNKFEDSTTRGAKIPSTVAQTTAMGQGGMAQVAPPQQPVAGGKQRNDSMSSESSYTMAGGQYPQPRQIPSIYSNVMQQQQQQMMQLQQQQMMQIQQQQIQQQALLQQQHQMAAHHQHHLHQQHQLQHHHHQQQQQHAVVAQQQQYIQASAGPLPPPQGAPHGHMGGQQQQQQAAASRALEVKALNPDAVEFKPGGAASPVSSKPPAAPHEKVHAQMVAVPQAAVTMIHPGQYNQPALVALYPPGLVQRGYLSPAAMAQHTNMQGHPVIVSQAHHDAGGVMSPTSPTGQQQQQLVYHQPQMIPHAGYMPQQFQHIPTSSAHMQFPPANHPGPYANPLQGHHGFHGSYPQNIG